jgi:hypothetical protein
MEKESYQFTDEELEIGKWPLPFSVIPNYMGINLCLVKGMELTRGKDGQLASLTIHFKPAELYAEESCKDERVGFYGEILQHKSQ